MTTSELLQLLGAFASAVVVVGGITSWSVRRYVSRLRREGPTANLEGAFDASLREIEDVWRSSLREVARPTAG